jgi:hypothetical protein
VGGGAGEVGGGGQTADNVCSYTIGLGKNDELLSKPLVIRS